ncbi:serine/threonine-protein phosphatase 4 catalytic subunit [Pancytospora epiphaga]|nr:serine/threonine-protein phosphatase 4 catalytic subunit [Pancytospora epiphaga]
METNWKTVLENLKNSILPQRETVLLLLENIRSLLYIEPNVLEVDAPINIVGDLHGQFYDFLHMMEIANATHRFLFLGDYVDRGYNSVELLLYILVLKQLSPLSIFMLRGNHENRAQTAVYGFKEECIRKYDEVVYWAMCNIFELLPIAAIAGDRFFCVHGGITPGLTLEILQSADRIDEFPEIGDIMWADPTEETPDFVQSQRGAGVLFGRRALKAFLAQLNDSRARLDGGKGNIVAVVRSHQLVFEGIREQFGKACITVWSAPNYCYKSGNMAAVMLVESNHHEYIFYGAVKEQYKEGAEVPQYFKEQKI